MYRESAAVISQTIDFIQLLLCTDMAGVILFERHICLVPETSEFGADNALAVDGLATVFAELCVALQSITIWANFRVR